MAEKKTYVTFYTPGAFFFEHYDKDARNGITPEEVIKEMIERKNIEKPSFETVNMFTIKEQEWNGYQVVDGKRKEIYGKDGKRTTCHIGEFYSIERIEKEEGKNSNLYHNVVNNGYIGAVKYSTGNFGAVNEGDVVISQEQALKLVEQGEKDRATNPNENQPGEE